jgi:hypothetical protein
LLEEDGCLSSEVRWADRHARTTYSQFNDETTHPTKEARAPIAGSNVHLAYVALRSFA